MPLILSVLAEEDVHAFAVVDDAAMADWPYAQAMGLNLPMSRIHMVEDWVRQGLTTDSTQTYLKVSDDETGEMVAGALWRFEPLDDRSTVKKHADSAGKEEVTAKEDEGAKMAAAFAAARKAMWEEFSSTYFPGQPHASECPHLLRCRPTLRIAEPLITAVTDSTLKTYRF
jgi:hypothetical protein